MIPELWINLLWVSILLIFNILGGGEFILPKPLEPWYVRLAKNKISA